MRGTLASRKLLLIFLRRIAYLEERLRLYGDVPHAESGSLDHVDVFNSSNSAKQPGDDMDRALRGINRLTLEPRLPEFYGASSPDVIVAAVETSAQSPDGRVPAEDSDGPEDRAKLWLGTATNLTFSKVKDTSLPTRAVAKSYIYCYFQTAHLIFPILNQDLLIGTFDDYFDGLPTEGRGYEKWSAVMYMTIALGHQYSMIDSDDELRTTAISSPQDGESCFQLAKSVLDDVPFSGGDISAVNATLLMVCIVPDLKE